MTSPFLTVEALEWLRKNPNAVIAPNFFHNKENSIAGVTSLYAAGATLVEAVVMTDTRILKDGIQFEGEGCDELEVSLPKVITKDLVDAIRSMHPDNFEEDLMGEDPYEGLMTEGGQKVTLWWD